VFRARLSLYVLATGLILLASAAGPAWAGLRPGSQDQVQPIDVVLVIDDSGSMRDAPPKSDVAGLRYAAARLFVDLALPGDRVGVVHYGNIAQGLGDAAGCSLADIDDEPPLNNCPLAADPLSRQRLRNVLAQPQILLGNTCMQLGLELARLLLNTEKLDRPQAILFLTDGLFTPRVCGATATADLNTVINDLVADGIVVYPILLGPDKDDDVASKLLKTGGHRFDASSAEDLFIAFSQVYAQLQPSRYALSLKRNFEGRLSLVTTPDQAVTQINFIIEHNALQSLSVGNERLSGSQLPGGGTFTLTADSNPGGEPQYDILTLTGNPLIGTWSLDLQPDSRRSLAVVDARTLPILLFPKADSTFAPRYVAQRDDGYLIIPAAFRDGSELALPLTLSGVRSNPIQGVPSNMRLLSVTTEPFTLTLQVGQEAQPLQLKREFTLIPGDFPRLQVISPTAAEPGLTAAGKRRLAVQWNSTEPLTDLGARAIVVGPKQTVLQFDAFDCDGSGCVSEDFTPEPGQHYDIWFLGWATNADGVVFNDYAHVSLDLPPLIQITGIPGEINLNADPGPFILTVLVQSNVDPGFLTAHLTLVNSRREPAMGVQHTLSLPPLPPSGSVAGKLTFDIGDLPPDMYIGSLKFISSRDLKVQPAEVVVKYLATHPHVQIINPPQRLELGEWIDPARLITQTLRLKYTPKVSNVAVTVELISPAQFPALIPSIAQPSETAAGVYNVGIALQAPYGLPTNWVRDLDIIGRFQFSVENGNVSPATLDFHAVRPGWLSLRLRCDPILGATHQLFCWLWPIRLRGGLHLDVGATVRSCLVGFWTWYIFGLIVSIMQRGRR